MNETWRKRRNVLHTMHDSELIRRYTLDGAGIMLVTDLIRDTLTSPTPCRNAIMSEMEVITTLTYLATGKMQLCSSDDLGLSQQRHKQTISFCYKQRHHTNNYSTFRTLLCRCPFPIKYVKYDSMVN